MKDSFKKNFLNLEVKLQMSELDTVLCHRAHNLNVSQITYQKKRPILFQNVKTFINLKAAMSVSYFYSIPSHTDKVILKVKYLKHFTVLFLLTAAQYAF